MGFRPSLLVLQRGSYGHNRWVSSYCDQLTVRVPLALRENQNVRSKTKLAVYLPKHAVFQKQNKIKRINEHVKSLLHVA